MSGTSSKFNASGPMLGYLYQCRGALLLAIEESKKFPTLAVSIERFDDVAFDQDDTPLKQVQLKHHVEAGALTDTSSDLWKTIRIWSEQIKANPQIAFERRFVILTTGTAPAHSAASNLRMPREKASDEADALELLRTAATSSSNKDTAAGRGAFLALSEQDQRNLLKAVQIHDNAPSITDARSEIEDRLEFAAPSGFVAHLVDHLEGWWFSQVIRSLMDASEPSISLLTLRQKIDEIASAFRSGELLLSADAEVVSSAALAASDGRIFVKQMRCVGLVETAIDMAKRDFYRATAQRSAWARENVLLDGESQRYDEGLIDRWQREGLALQSKAAPVSDEQKRQFGRDMFHWANRVQMPFRNRHELWLCSGSYQVLADGVHVGWHPDHHAMFSSSPKVEAA